MNKTIYYVKAKREYWKVLQSICTNNPGDALSFINDIKEVEFVDRYNFIVEINTIEEQIKLHFNIKEMIAILSVAIIEKRGVTND